MQKVLSEVRRNLASGLTVALVSVPLSISLAIAAGAPPLTGIITAVWAGAFASFFGGSNYNIIGPAAALSGVLAAASLTYGPDVLPLAAVVSSLFIFMAYALGWQRYMVFIPSAVTHGFTLGVAATIALNQLNFALGLTGLPPHPTLVGNIGESIRHLSAVEPAALGTFAVALALLFLILKYLPRVPGPIVVAALGIGIGYGSTAGVLPFSLQTLLTKYGELQMSVIKLPAFLHQPLTETLSSILDPGVLKLSFTVAVIAILETLLTAKISDGMTHTRFRQRQEIFGLSLANLVAGLAGGVPASGVLARTALNVRSGATSWYSAFINAICILLIAVLFFSWFQYLPLPIVAAILVYVSVRLVQIEHFSALFRLDRRMFWLSMIVAVISFVEDPMLGILFGAAAALLMFVSRLSKGQSEVTIHDEGKPMTRVSRQKLHELTHHGCVTVYRFAGELTYFNARSHEEVLVRIRCKSIVFSLRNVYYIDPDGVDELAEMIADRESVGIKVVLSGAGEFVRPILEKTRWFQLMEREGKVFESSTAALAALGYPLGDARPAKEGVSPRTE